MTIAEDLKQSVKALVCHEMDIVHDGDWFKDFVKGIVDERLNEIQDSEKDSDGWEEAGVEGWWTRLSGDKYFLVRWGEGYSTKKPEVWEIKEIIESSYWHLGCDFIDSLIDATPSDKLKFTDLSGDVYFECIDNS